MPSVFRNDVVTFFLENKTTVSGVLYPPSPHLQCYVRKKNYNVESKRFFAKTFSSWSAFFQNDFRDKIFILSLQEGGWGGFRKSDHVHCETPLAIPWGIALPAARTSRCSMSSKHVVGARRRW